MIKVFFISPSIGNLYETLFKTT